MLSGLFPGAEHVIDKRPDNFLYIGLIKTPVPERKDHPHDAQSARQLSVDLLPASGSQHGIRARSHGHGALLRAVPAIDVALEIPVRGRHSRFRLRRAGARTAAGGREIARVLRARVGRALHVVPARGECGQDGERVAGARAALSTVVGTLATLCGAACAATPLSARSPPRRAISHSTTSASRRGRQAE